MYLTGVVLIKTWNCIREPILAVYNSAIRLMLWITQLNHSTLWSRNNFWRIPVLRVFNIFFKNREKQLSEKSNEVFKTLFCGPTNFIFWEKNRLPTKQKQFHFVWGNSEDHVQKLTLTPSNIRTITNLYCASNFYKFPRKIFCYSTPDSFVLQLTNSHHCD